MTLPRWLKILKCEKENLMSVNTPPRRRNEEKEEGGRCFKRRELLLLSEIIYKQT
jgi:hypothetical protein